MVFCGKSGNVPQNDALYDVDYWKKNFINDGLQSMGWWWWWALFLWSSSILERCHDTSAYFRDIDDDDNNNSNSANRRLSFLMCKQCRFVWFRFAVVSQMPVVVKSTAVEHFRLTKRMPEGKQHHFQTISLVRRGMCNVCVCECVFAGAYGVRRWF